VYLKQIQREDEEHMFKEQNHGLATDINLAKDKLKCSSTNLMIIARDKAVARRDRIDAELANMSVITLFMSIHILK
jgi:hypothetical protein